MPECVICKKIISENQDLCSEHKNILNSISYYYNKDPEVHRLWDSLVEVVKSKTTFGSNDVEDVFKFIDEIKAESCAG